MTSGEKKKYFLFYTGAFLIMLPIVYYAFWSQGKTFVRDGDGFVQHYHALMYYGKWLRKILKTLWEKHRLIFPEWDFSIGYGSNVLTTLHYYVIGDPLTLLSALVPARYTVYLYGFLVVLRNYLAGFTFSCFCVYMKKKNMAALLSGALLYAFCVYALQVGTYHPFFVNPMIYFPLVLMGAEKTIRKERPYVLIFSVCLCAVSNFYFFYMTAILTAVYAVIRVAGLYGFKGRAEAARALFRIAGRAFTGVLLSAPLFLPVILMFLQDYRSDIRRTIGLFYAKDYYQKLPAAFAGTVNAGRYVMLGYGAPALLAVWLLLVKKDKRKRPLKLLFAAAVIFLCFPVFGYALNGFSYISNRWCWAVSMLTAFILVDMWEELLRMGRKELLLLTALTAGYIGFCCHYQSKQALFYMTPVFAILILALALCGSLSLKKKETERKLWAAQGLLLGMVLLNTAYTAACKFSKNAYNLSDWYFTAQEVEKKETENPDRTMQGLTEKDGTFWRYTGKGLTQNTSLVNGTHNTQYYWSLSNGNIARFMIETEMLIQQLHLYTSLDDRIALDALLDVRYYVKSTDGEYVPPGWELKEERDGYQIYENENALPLAYTYDSYVTEEEMESLTGIQKEEAMAQSVILEEAADGIAQGDPAYTEEELSYTVTAGEGVKITEDGFTVSQKDATATLQLTGESGKTEVYLRMAGYAYAGSSGAKLQIKKECADGSAVEKRLKYYTLSNTWPTQMDNFCVNLGYSESSAQTITLTFPRKGTYTFDSMTVYARSVENDDSWLLARAADAWEDEEIGTDTVQGKVTLDEEKLLFLSIPYDGGWTAYVDGEKTEVLKANYAFTALKVPAGEHRILLVYRTPGLRMGLLLSLAGLAALIGMAGYRRRKSARAFAPAGK